jgi:site-specific DNA-methyltransferase (adenine-specific)
VTTKTSKFGVSKRESHDASEYYKRKMSGQKPLVGEVPLQNNYAPGTILDRIFVTSSRNMIEIPDNSVHMMITSPPYNVGKEYDADYSLEAYLKLLTDVFTETHRVLVNGGRVAINVANVGRKPYLPLNCYISRIMQGIGFQMRGEIIWNKSASAGTSTAWGSWQSASNPTLRDVHEYIQVYSKGDYARKPVGKSTITKEEFLEYTKSIWSFPAASAKRICHPAPFPCELPLRLIKLYTYEGDIVLDPFMGSGQTAIAAKSVGRRYIGYDLSQEYTDLANKRIAEMVKS